MSPSLILRLGFDRYRTLYSVGCRRRHRAARREVGPVEIKLGENKVPEAFASIDRLRRKVAANPAARNPKPSFSAVVVGAGELARYDRGADAYVIPLTSLGA